MCDQICKFSTFEFPKIKTDFITNIGSMCRVAHHLRKNHLRNLASPLDWMISDKLEVVFELFKNDLKEFFLSCSFVKDTDDFIGKADIYRQVVRGDSNDMVATHYSYSYEDLETQGKRINTQARKRWTLIKNKICSSKNTVFVRSEEFDLEKPEEFLHNVSKLFGNTGGEGGYTLINVSHNEKLKEDEIIMEKFDLGENLMITHYNTCENEKDFRRNIPFWTTMMQKSTTTPDILIFKNKCDTVKTRFIRSCQKRKAFSTKRKQDDLDSTQF